MENEFTLIVEGAFGRGPSLNDDSVEQVARVDG